MRFILLPLLFPLLLCLLTFFISSSSSSSGEAGNGDVKALIAFKTSSVTRDPNGFFTGWTAADSLGPCSWRGVICSLQSRVTSLDLSDAQISGSLHLDLLLGSLPLLQHLHLRGNNFTGNLSHVFPCNLVTLDLSSNYFSNSNPISLSCHRLTYLNLSHNGLQHKIPSVLGSFKNLEVLSLAKNQFSGEIPPELGRTCGSIRVLDLAGNALQGGLPSTFISCSSLQTLNLESNELSGDFLDTVVGTLPALRELLVSFNNLKGPIPPSIANCSHLQVLDLRFNRLNGSLPTWFCSASNSSLAKIFLAGNLISGAVPPELGNCKNLKRLDLSFNKLRGSIPWQVWALPNLSDLVMWGNSLTGELPETICFSGGNLETLILNNNLITGTIPVSLASCTNLIMVSLSSNRLTGEVHSGLANLNNLAILQLGNNSLTGEIPKELGKCESLIWLDLSSNNFSGSIPPELSSQSGLIIPGPASRKQYAYLRSDRRDCSVVGGLVEFDDIRAGWFASSPWAHSCSLIYTRLNLYSFTNNGTMIYLDLSYNSLSGAIPDTFGSMSDLLVLNLGHNMLTGSIPDVLGDLKQVGVLDVSYNELQGFLPGSLGMLTFLSDFDVSNNNLTGPIPSHGQLATFVSSRYENNSGLCGVPLPPCGAGSAIPDDPDLNSTGKEHFIDAGLVFSVIAGVITGLAFTLYFHTLKHYCKKK